MKCNRCGRTIGYSSCKNPKCKYSSISNHHKENKRAIKKLRLVRVKE
jgi:hypothetical protein